MQIDTKQEVTDKLDNDAAKENIGIWEGYLSTGPSDLATSGITTGKITSSGQGRLTVNYDDKSFSYQAADGTVTTGAINKTFPLGDMSNTSLGMGTLAFTDQRGSLWILSHNMAPASSRWTYYNINGGLLNVVTTTPKGITITANGAASSDLWYSEQKYALQPPPVGIIKWTGYLSGGPTLLGASSQDGSLTAVTDGSLFVNYADRSFTYQASDGTQIIGTVKTTFAITGGGSMSIGAGTLAFTDEKGQLWVFTQNPPGTGARWQYIPTADGGALNLVSKTASGNATVQTGGYATTDLWDDSRKYGTAVPEVCYLPGTLIATPQGHRAIETLTAGDEIFVLRGSEILSETIIWAGSGLCTTRTTRYKDVAGYPVRIRAGALGNALPHKDLFVTPEHCLYLDGGLIPARMLVNGHSITYEETLSTYSYHHIELARHGLIFANGALSESYLDTGNRFIFGFQTKISSDLETGKSRAWQKDAAAPLMTNQDFVEPVWRRLAARCGAPTCYALPSCPSEEIALETLDGQTILPLRTRDDGYVFRFHPKGQAVYFKAPTRRPCDMIGPFLDDRRELGVLVQGIQIFTPENCFDIHPNSIAGTGSGWNDVEALNQRWTKSKALIPMGEAELNEPVVLFISTATAGTSLHKERRAV
ncbi:Hint domain-containing protein [Asaia sp. BMEF1]|uniref:Hint domain-containing protein n=1 Tax=Asaia sp. BMEF1 TaxID=3155932 RepID=UPI003F67A6E5